MHMIRKGQMSCPEGSTMSTADQFYSLAVRFRSQQRNSVRLEALVATEPQSADGAARGPGGIHGRAGILGPIELEKLA